MTLSCNFTIGISQIVIWSEPYHKNNSLLLSLIIDWAKSKKTSWCEILDALICHSLSLRFRKEEPVHEMTSPA